MSDQGPLPYRQQLPGWYPDPAGSGLARWWDGNQWGPVQYPPPMATPALVPQVPVPHYMTVVAPKSVGVAFLLAFLFGPLGLLYASVPGGLIMLAVSFFGVLLSFVTFGFTFFLSWLICVVWACVAANSHNTRVRYQAYR